MMKIVTKNNISFILCLILVITLISSYKKDRPIYDEIHSRVLDFASPVLQETSSSFYSVRNFFNNIAQLFLTFEENKTLKKRNEFLEYYFYLYKQVEEENQQLKEALNFTKSLPDKFISAQIIAKSNNYLHQEYIINAGKKDGIKKWQMVLANNYLIGRIVSVSENTANLLLITDHASKIPVISLNSKINFIASGITKNELLCNYLNTQTLEENELVVTSYSNQQITPNIIVGSVIKRENVFYIKPIIDLNKIEFVQVLQSSYE